MASKQNYEFSRVVKIDDSILNKKLKVYAEEPELKTLANRLNLERVNFLNLEYIIIPKEDIKGAFSLIAELQSNVTKFIINEYEENALIDEKFDVILINEKDLKPNLELLQDFDIELLVEGTVDIGEIASQYLSLCIYM